MQPPSSQTGLPFDLTNWDRLHRPIWLFDPVTCRGLYANASALQLWDAETLDELLARDFSKLSAAVRTRVERLATATAGGGTVSERWSFYPKGKPVTVQALISTLDLGDGRTVLQFEASPADVEEGELRAVEALRHTSSLITLFDGEGRAIFTNPAAFAAYGGVSEAFIDRFSDAMHGVTALSMVLGGHVLSELRQVCTVQGERWHYIDARSVQDPATGATSVLLSERDVTAQVEAEGALVAAEARAEIAETKQRFLANMSHELRTPLNSILGFAGLLAGSALDAAQAYQLSRVTEAGATLLGIVNDVVDLAELDSGDVALVSEPFSLQALADAAMGPHLSTAAAKGLELSVDAADDTPDLLVGDAARLAKAISHYVANAVKFTARGSVAVLFAGSAMPGGYALEVSVTDTGPGLDAATQGRLFRRFSPGDDTARKSVGGSGLGLAVCKEFAELMGGEVGVESTLGQGARFWLRVPLQVGGGQADAAEEAECRPLNILYADDHENNRTLVRTLLESHGHHCDTVEDGAQAVQAVRRGDYDLILMDIQMPVQDGVSATAEIRTFGGPQSRLPILALTANTLSEQRATYEAVGMNDCIAKPVNVAELFSKVARWSPPAAADAGRLRSA